MKGREIIINKIQDSYTWTNISTRYPDSEKTSQISVIVYSETEGVHSVSIDYLYDFHSNITHWMYYPEMGTSCKPARELIDHKFDYDFVIAYFKDEIDVVHIKWALKNEAIILAWSPLPEPPLEVLK